MSINYRPGQSSDTNQLATLHHTAWYTTYSHLIDPTFSATQTPEHFQTLWQRIFNTPTNHVWIAVTANEEVIGFLLFNQNPNNSDPLPKNEVFGLYLLQSYQRQGIGETLFKLVIAHYQNLKEDFCLWVLAENLPASNFYQKQGGLLISRKSQTLGQKSHVALCFNWPFIPSSHGG
ncbi:GNAT family N-acetyltransferase [Vagococcus salmoninarum]|uniref:GNAT family N-acetyltransferase n=1 Tax=Vagococcus salmoninarum TaxID=2739 RepID=UPI0028D5075B|nr:GNAT family N-acetyltransferase [Vagococcus salmoninarum]